MIDRTPRRLRPGVHLVVSTADRAVGERLPGLAAEVAFWTVLSLPALLLTVLAAGTVFGGAVADDWRMTLIDRLTEVATVALTSQTIDTVVRPVLEQLVQEGGVGLASTAFVATLWVASRAVKVVVTALTIVYDRPGQRAAWQTRLLGLGLTLGALVVGTVLLPLLLAGPNFGEQLSTWLGGEIPGVAQIWRLAYWPATVVAAALALTVLYHLAVPGSTPWRRDLPGAALATLVWLLGSGALRLYGTWVMDGDTVYGPLAGPIVGLLWLWLTGFAVLLGGALNAQIEHLWPVDGGQPIRLRTADVPAAAPVPVASGTDESSGVGPGERDGPTPPAAPSASDGDDEPALPAVRPRRRPTR
ncbi:YihY/virulence factor BrkB family protein [Egicoccus sp. AB-alg2]|uniref:YihY/virulence factor BrkB family protein n=1 Tax=Egicoccus sp. AB-alg2 TaxID=3242693 RepID=UPI00359D0D5E